MKYIRFATIILALLFCIASCKKDFLDVPDKTSLVRQAYVKDIITMEEFLNGTYLNLTSGCYTGLFIIYGDLVADNAKLVAGSPFLEAHYSWNQQASNGSASLQASSKSLNEIWSKGYKIIRDCSFILEDISKYAEQNPAKAENMKGQAYALRGLVHFALVNAFAQTYSFTPDGSHVGIPYISTSDWSQPISRQTVAEVYSGIISDLTTATSLLPPGPINDARFMNHNAAKALLSRVYLFKGEHLQAKDLATQVLSGVPLMTNTPQNRMYPDSLFNKGESEALFQLYPEDQYINTILAGAFFRFELMYATNDIVTILQERPDDLRNLWVTNSSGNWLVNKFPEGRIPGWSLPQTAYYHTLLRSSEMYLIAAESNAKLGQEDSARFYLDKIRQRADITAPNSTASGPSLLDSIYKERRKELAFEGMRMSDIQRWKKDVNRLDASNPAAISLPFGDNKTIAPIPLEDVRIAGLQQNTGY